MKAALISNIKARYQIYNILPKLNVNDLNKKKISLLALNARGGAAL